MLRLQKYYEKKGRIRGYCGYSIKIKIQKFVLTLNDWCLIHNDTLEKCLILLIISLPLKQEMRKSF